MADELWRKLRVGDKIRLVEFPHEFIQGCLHPETSDVYKRLIARRRPLTIFEVKDGGPWIRCRFRRADGIWEHHYLLFNHGGIVRVKPRAKSQEGNPDLSCQSKQPATKDP